MAEKEVQAGVKKQTAQEKSKDDPEVSANKKTHTVKNMTEEKVKAPSSTKPSTAGKRKEKLPSGLVIIHS